MFCIKSNEHFAKRYATNGPWQHVPPRGCPVVVGDRFFPDRDENPDGWLILMKGSLRTGRETRYGAYQLR